MIVLAETGWCCTMCSRGGCMRSECPGDGCTCAQDHGHAESFAQSVRLQQEHLLAMMPPMDTDA